MEYREGGAKYTEETFMEEDFRTMRFMEYDLVFVYFCRM